MMAKSQEWKKQGDGIKREGHTVTDVGEFRKLCCKMGSPKSPAAWERNQDSRSEEPVPVVQVGANHLKGLSANKHFSYSLLTCSLELLERRRPRTAEGRPRERERPFHCPESSESLDVTSTTDIGVT
ncbi:hypothetical protein H920_06001 [Fukomys damarensis]|uniref:Uncharacterized protein n=1 Tax=Fukomys damarensis TaxID=885580 RepID=A0A091DQP4_FUKDA|nr:hypothetical protein H920_06001 [Fukomys damarensis]